jgi:predicted nicotinamide N-methyase
MALPLTQKNEIRIGNKLIYIETISDIDELFDELLSKGEEHEDVKDERIPYWADLWPSAVALSEYLAERNVIQQGTKVLELGCGLGLPGILAGQFGGDVVFTDYIQDALDLAKRNWELNSAKQAVFKQMDWRDPDSEIEADIILASDIAYERKSFNDLISAFRILLKPGTSMFIAEPNRAFAQSFVPEIEKAGFWSESEKVEVTFRSRLYPVHIHKIKHASP